MPAKQANKSRARGTSRRARRGRGHVIDAGEPASPTVAASPESTRVEESPRRRWGARLGVAIAALATFGRGVPNPLVTTWDDGRFLVDFEPVRSIDVAHLRSIWTEVHFQAWHPLHLMSYWLDVPWAGPNGPVLHAVNLLLWILALWLVLRVFERLGLSLGPALVATLVIGLHPIQVEAVSWATGRKEILALIFACLAFLAHLDPRRYPTLSELREASGRERLGRLLASMVPGAFYLLAAMSKTTVLPLPAVLLLSDVLIRRQPLKSALTRQLPLLVLGAGFGAVVIGIWQDHEMIRSDAGGTDWTGRASLVAATFTHYVLTAWFPAKLSPVYPIERGGDFSPLVWVLPALFGVAAAFAWRLRAGRALFALLAIVIVSLPVLNFVPVYFQRQDRYLSLPLLPAAYGIGVALEAALARAPGRRSEAGVMALAFVAVAALATRTVVYQGAWSSDLSLWRHATRTHPGAFYAWLKLGEYLRDEGRLDESIEAYGRGIEAAPDLKLNHAAYFNAVAMRDERRFELPARSLSWTARYHAALDDPAALREVAGVMAEEGYRDAATLALGRSLDLDPVDDARLERAAQVQLERDHEWLARFYLSRMTRPPEEPRLRRYQDEPAPGTAPSPTSD